MTDTSSFTDAEIETIKLKMNQKFDNGMIGSLIILSFFSFIAPYIPGRRNGKPMVETMPYWDAVLFVAIVFVFIFIVIWISHYYRSRIQFSQNRKFLRRKKVSGEVINKSKGLFSSFENKIKTNLKDDFKLIRVEKEESMHLDVGDAIEIEYEDHTKAILNVLKLDV